MRRVGKHPRWRWSLLVAPVALIGGFAPTAQAAGRTTVASTVNSSWQHEANIAGHGNGHISSISCPTSTFCAAVDGLGAAIIKTGSTWSPPQQVFGGPFASVSCPSSTFCMAVGDYLAYEYDGTSWTNSPGISPPVYALTAVSCVSSTFCVAFDGFGDVFYFNGTTWTSPSRVDTTTAVVSLSCPTTSFCAAVDQAGDTLVLKNGQWQLDPFVLASSYPSVSCPSSTYCVAVGGTYVPALKHSVGIATQWNGSGWSSAEVVDNVNQLYSVSCPTVTNCSATDGSDQVLAFSGGAWQASGPIDTVALTSISCPTTSCTVTDIGGGVLAGHGLSWSAPNLIDPASDLAVLSCASARSCLAIDGSGQALRFNGVGWTKASGFDPNEDTTSVSCPSASFCMTVDSSGLAISISGRTKTPYQLPRSARLSAVSCPTTTRCVAVDLAGQAFVYSGGAWTGPEAITGTRNLASISCPTVTFCMASDVRGATVTWNGSTWGTPFYVDTADQYGAYQLSCASDDYCVVVWQGYAAVWTGGSWSPTPPVVGLGLLTSVSCVLASTSCIAADSAGNAFSWDGSTWSGPTSADTSGRAQVVSCPTTSFCALGDSAGNAVWY